FVSAFDALRRVTLDVEWKSETETSESVQASSEEFTMRIKGYARYLGADLVGTTRLNPAYVYSHNARSQGKWGEPVVLNHSHAVVVGVEMNHEMIRHAPDPIATTETALKYFEAAKVAMLVAAYIRRLGYEARPHVDGNYRVMCVPVAVDAGLGELGRLGLLITPEFGPRVRLSVVTTNLPLLQDAPIVFGVQDFCDFCKKCATNCPSGSIDRGSKKVIRGVEKWQSEQDSCYRFWRRQGSDCSICVKVCPYSHSNTAVHNWVRWTIRRNRLARRLALWGDDLFYGRRPKETVPLPDWHSKIS
ncbi:MAG: reductive dehalogenase, partial [bacterium]